MFARRPNSTFRPATLTALAALMLAGLNGAASAQFSDEPPRAYQPPAKRAKPDRNDAYSGPSNTPGLGTLDDSGAKPSGGGYDQTYGQGYNQPQPYGATNDRPQAYGAQSQSGGYAPSYGAPARPYGADAPAPQGIDGGPAQYPRDTYANAGRTNDAYRPQPDINRYGAGNSEPAYRAGQAYSANDSYRAGPGGSGGYGQPYSAPPADYDRGYDRDDRGGAQGPVRGEHRDGAFTSDEITSAGHKFFGSVSQGLANVIEHAFKRQGRPNGYILGEEAGGAFVAGLRYGEGQLYTRDAGTHKVYWQGPSIGWDAGAAGSKVMVLVYNLRDPNEVFDRFGGVDGSAYVFGGIGLTVLKRDHITLAPIRSGVGLRFGANIGYLKFTRRATWNPF